MTEIIVKDEGGSPMTMINFGTFRSSLFGHTVDYIRDVHARLPEFTFRDGDVLLASYPKAGCTWTFEVLTMLMKGRAEGPEYSKMYVMLEASAQENMEPLTSPRLLNTHLPYERVPHGISSKEVRVVLVVRNPKDAAVSFYHMMTGMKHYNYSGHFRHWLPLYMRGDLAYVTYADYLKSWERAFTSKKHKMVVIYYEDMKKDIANEARKLSDFLGIPINEKLIAEIAEQCQFNEMKSRFDAKMLGAGSYKPDKTYGFMRKGDVGDWKRWFTVAESEAMEVAMEGQLKGSMFNFTYQL